VGRDKARYLAARLLIPPVVTVHAAFTAHGGRLGGLTVRSLLPPFPKMPWGSHVAGPLLPCLPSCGPSPCRQLSCLPSTIATLTADGDLGGFQDGFPISYLSLSFAFSSRSPTFTLMDSTRARRCGFRNNPYCLLAAPKWAQCKPGAAVPSFHNPARADYVGGDQTAWSPHLQSHQARF